MSRKDCTVFCKAAWENWRGRELFSTKASVCYKVQPKIWHLVSFLYLPGILPHVQKGWLVGYSLTPWFWPSDESADSFLPAHSASFGFLVLLGHLQVSLRVTVVRGTVQGAEKKQRVAHTGISHFWLCMSSDTAEVLGEVTWLVFSRLPLRCSQRKKNKIRKDPAAMRGSSPLRIGSCPFLNNLSISSKVITKVLGKNDTHCLNSDVAKIQYHSMLAY